MAKCTDCPNSVSTPFWKRCEPCAERRLHLLMGNGKDLPRPLFQRYPIGATVKILSRDILGKIVRRELEIYTIDLEGGERCRAHIRDLREPTTG